MTLDQIDQMVRQANPVPDLTVLEPVDASVLAFDQQRRTEMQTNDRIEVDQEQEKPGRGILVGIAAAVVIVIGVLVLVRPIDAPVAGQPTTAVDLATAFLEAYAAFDADKAASYLADSAVAEFGAFGGDVQDLRLELSQEQATGFKLLLDSCEAQNSSPSGTSVRCAYDYHGIRSDEIGLGPYSGSWFDITVLEGEIVSVSDHIQLMSNGFSSEVWEPFAVWVSTIYPEDAAIMYWDGSLNSRLTEESIPLWEQRSIEYVAVARDGAGAQNIGNQFIEAYAAFDADKAASYLAADADLSEFTGDVEGLRPSIRWAEATGFQRLFDSCVATGATPTLMSVRCPYDFHGIRSEEIGLGPYSGSWVDIAIEDGRIVSVSDDIVFMENGFSEQMWEPFAQWIGRTYPDDGAVMYLNWPNIFTAQLTEESIGLWEEHSIEYVAVVSGS